MKSMKRYMWVVPVVALAVAALFMASHHFVAASTGDQNNGVQTESVVLGTSTRGVVFKTAAMNSDGSVANCFRCSRTNTHHLGTGVYQVAFDENVTANLGWSRWIQVDTLTFGSISGVSCTTADRAGLSSAVWVACFNTSGVSTDTSFFTFVAR